MKVKEFRSKITEAGERNMIYVAVILIFLLVWTLISAILIGLFNKDKSIDKLKYFDEDYAIKEKYENKKIGLA